MKLSFLKFSTRDNNNNYVSNTEYYIFYNSIIANIKTIHLTLINNLTIIFHFLIQSAIWIIYFQSRPFGIFDFEKIWDTPVIKIIIITIIIIEPLFTFSTELLLNDNFEVLVRINGYLSIYHYIKGKFLQNKLFHYQDLKKKEKKKNFIPHPRSNISFTCLLLTTSINFNYRRDEEIEENDP